MSEAMDVADYIIYKAKDYGMVSNLQLQKIMYFLNAKKLVVDNEPLVDESFERWDYGPVIRSVYTEYSMNGGRKISMPENHIALDENQELVEKEFDVNKLQIDENSKKIIDDNIKFLVDISPFHLVDKSHEETQWNNLGNNMAYSDNETIKFYRNKFKKDEQMKWLSPHH
ncbi:Panacea domain-containing protein [Holzapfeliella sp. JNUCC 80]